MDKESIKAYVHHDPVEEFSLKKFRAGMCALAVFFLLVFVFGIYYGAYLSAGILTAVFVSYECWFYIWSSGYFRDRFAQRLFLKGSWACFSSLFFALSAFVLADVSGNLWFIWAFIPVFILWAAIYYFAIIFRIRKKSFTGKEAKYKNWGNYFVSLAAAGYLGARLFISEAGQNTAFIIAMLLLSFVSLLFIPGTQALFKYFLVKKAEK